MTVTPFPGANSSAADMRRAAAVARKLALGVRFRGRPSDAARWALIAPPFEVAQALAADDALALVKVRCALAKAHRSGDLDTVTRLRPQLARVCAQINEVAKRYGVRGWRQIDKQK